MKLPSFPDYLRGLRLRARGWRRDGEDAYWRRPIQPTDNIRSHGFDIYFVGGHVYASSMDWAEKVDDDQSPETH